MRRVSWILGLGAALVMACGVESAPKDLPQSSTAETPSSIDLNPGSTEAVICPELPPDCCIVKTISGCKVCVQSGC